MSASARIMWSIGFGLERLASPILRAPRIALVVLLLIGIGAVTGAMRLTFTDDVAHLFAAPVASFERYADFRARFLTGADMVLVVVDGDFRRDDHWRGLQSLAAGLDGRTGTGGAVSILSLANIETAAGPALAPDMFFEPSLEVSGLDVDRGGGTDGTAADWVRHPLNVARLLTPDLDGALIRVVLDPERDALEAVTQLRAHIDDVRAALPDGMALTLTGLPILRGEIVQQVTRQQPWLLGAGLAIGFALGVVLMGRWSDALVVAVMPVFAITCVYGALGHSGIAMTTLINNLPLLVLALAFTTSLHVVYAARRDLERAGYEFQALASTMRRVGPAVALSALTTAVAFLTFVFSGSRTLAEFGLIGAAAVMGVCVAAMIVQPVVIRVALDLGWRPIAPGNGRGVAARWIEVATIAGARAVVARGRVMAIAAIVATAGCGWAFVQLPTSYSLTDEIPAASTLNTTWERLDRDFGGTTTLHLPLPVAIDLDDDPLQTLPALRAAHEAAVAAFPGHPVLSPWTLVDWLNRTGRPLTPASLQAVLDAVPAALSGAILSTDGEASALVVGVGAEAAVDEAAARLETVVGAALGRELRGHVTGLALVAADRSEVVLRNLSHGLALAAIVASLLVAIAFRSAPLFVVALWPNLLPVLMVGASLSLTGSPLELASVLAMTIALGIAVDGTVHVLNAHRHCRAARPPMAAMARAMREIGPVLVISTAVLGLGLAPALGSWSPAIATFAGFAIVTLGFGLVADLVVLPPLAMLAARRASRPPTLNLRQRSGHR